MINSPPPSAPIFEPEFSFLPFGCDDCGARFPTSSDLAVHKATCRRGLDTRSLFGFDAGGVYGVADGGRRA